MRHRTVLRGSCLSTAGGWPGTGRSPGKTPPRKAPGRRGAGSTGWREGDEGSTSRTCLSLVLESMKLYVLLFGSTEDPQQTCLWSINKAEHGRTADEHVKARKGATEGDVAPLFHCFSLSFPMAFSGRKTMESRIQSCSDWDTGLHGPLCPASQSRVHPGPPMSHPHALSPRIGYKAPFKNCPLLSPRY